jgi:hypothetical protein
MFIKQARIALLFKKETLGMLGIGKNDTGRLFDAKIRVIYLVKSSGWVLIERWGKMRKKRR